MRIVASAGNDDVTWNIDTFRSSDVGKHVEVRRLIKLICKGIQMVYKTPHFIRNQLNLSLTSTKKNLLVYLTYTSILHSLRSITN